MTFRGRRSAAIENDKLRVTVLEGGGHIAEILDKRTGVSPLWIPEWDSIEPADYDARRHPQYGAGADASLLAGIMGHNLCLDIFGGPSEAEAAAGFPVHGEASIAAFRLESGDGWLAMHAELPEAELTVLRQLTLDGDTVRVRENVTNLAATDRPVGWTEHVTLGPPFLVKATTELAISADRSMVYPGVFGPADYLEPGREFIWPDGPRTGGGTVDMRRYSAAARSSAYTAHRMDIARDDASFSAFSREHGLVFSYGWRRADFPWLGIWEENHSRTVAPWNGRALMWGLEFGVSPFPESRRAMIERGRLFDTPTFKWIPALSSVSVAYTVVLRPASAVEAAAGC